MSTEKQQFVHESQKERWMKYGANVALVSLIVVILAGLVIYLSQRYDKRIDTTAAGLYSLKPQTKNIIKDNTQKIKLVSLYSAKVYSQKEQRQVDSPHAPVVRDLLEEYASNGKNIEVQALDPITQPTDGLMEEAMARYGGQVEPYRKFIADFTATHEQLTSLTAAEAGALANVQTDSFGNDERGQNLSSLVNTIKEEIPNDLKRLKEQIDRGMKATVPAYRDVVEAIKDTLDVLGQRATQLSRLGTQIKDDPQIPQVIRDYLLAAGPRYEQIGRTASETTARANGLGELKLSDLQQAMKEEDIILVMGEHDWKVINRNQVWVTDTRDVQTFLETNELKERFAGEQAVTTAILGVTSPTKQKVVFIRPGGGPLASPGFPPFQRGGPFSVLAQRLKGYNYEVMEKDISGMWEMQQRMQPQQIPSPPEPSEAEIKDALWIVLDIPGDAGASPQLNTKLAEHLKGGGSAMVLAMPGADALVEALKDYGISLETDYTVVHEAPQGERPKSSDWSVEIQQMQTMFVLNRYGDHMLTKPMQSLDALLRLVTPVRTTAVQGVQQTSLLPIPENVKIWGERDQQSVRDEKAAFNTDGAMPDLSGPLFAGAAAEKGTSRVIVIGALASFTSEVLTARDPVMAEKNRILVTRFPGNSELFNNSVFWLTKMEPMIAISPAAMEVSRISYMSTGALGVWRVGVLLILLPGLVLAAGIWMYFARRD